MCHARPFDALNIELAFCEKNDSAFVSEQKQTICNSWLIFWIKLYYAANSEKQDWKKKDL